MAIKYYVGVPRSGKTYKAMTVLYYTFVDNSQSFFDELLIKYNMKKPKELEFDNAYTNINQFNFEISEKIYPLDFKELYSKLSALHQMYMLKSTDEELIKKAKELNIFRTLFVLDECQNYLKSKDDKVLVWWFTYHAHLHHEIILITQDLTLVNNEYKRVAEYFYRAIPSRFRMSKNTFKYIQYSTYGMYDKDKIGVVTVKANKKIFGLYVSGSDTNGKSIIHKYIFFALVTLIVCIISVYSFLSSIGIDEEEIQATNSTIETNQALTTSTNQSQNISLTQEIKTINENEKLFKFNCFKNMCNYRFENKQSIKIPSNILKTYLLNIDDTKKYLEIKHSILYIYVLVNENTFNFLYKSNSTQGVTNEKNNDEDSGLISIN